MIVNDKINDDGDGAMGRTHATSSNPGFLVQILPANDSRSVSHDELLLHVENHDIQKFVFIENANKGKEVGFRILRGQKEFLLETCLPIFHPKLQLACAIFSRQTQATQECVFITTDK
jgi:hypothetical protein